MNKLSVFFILLTLVLSPGSSFGLDAAGFDPLPVAVKAKQGGVPIGAVIAWTTGNMPEQGEWLECNGQSTSGYPELAQIVGPTVPDYRGMFLRGHGSQTSGHYGSITHSSGGLGELQGDAIRDIVGYWRGDSTGWYGGAVRSLGDTTDHGIRNQDGATSTNYRFEASRVVPTANENRPVNKAVRYLMRAK